MKPSKLVIIAAVIILAIIALSITISMTNKSEIIRQQFEIHASKALGTEVSLKALNISLTNGRGDLQQLKVRNPQKYNSEYAIEIGDATIQFDLASLRGDVYVIDNVTIYGARFTVEQLGMQTNLGELRDNLKDNRHSTPDDKDSNQSQQEINIGENDSSVKLAIRRLTMSNTIVSVITEGYGSSEIEIANLTLTNIGSAKNGLNPQQLTEAVMQQLLTNVNGEAKGKIKDIVIDKVKDKLSKGLDKLLGK